MLPWGVGGEKEKRVRVQNIAIFSSVIILKTRGKIFLYIKWSNYIGLYAHATKTNTSLYEASYIITTHLLIKFGKFPKTNMDVNSKYT